MTVGAWQNTEKTSRETERELDIPGVKVKATLDGGADVLIVMLGMNDIISPAVSERPADIAAWADRYRALLAALRERLHPRVVGLATITLATEDSQLPKNRLGTHFNELLAASMRAASGCLLLLTASDHGRDAPNRPHLARRFPHHRRLCPSKSRRACRHCDGNVMRSFRRCSGGQAAGEVPTEALGQHRQTRPLVCGPCRGRAHRELRRSSAVAIPFGTGGMTPPGVLGQSSEDPPARAAGMDRDRCRRRRLPRDRCADSVQECPHARSCRRSQRTGDDPRPLAETAVGVPNPTAWPGNPAQRRQGASCCQSTRRSPAATSIPAASPKLEWRRLHASVDQVGGADRQRRPLGRQHWPPPRGRAWRTAGSTLLTIGRSSFFVQQRGLGCNIGLTTWLNGR